MIDFIKYYLFVIIISLLIGKAIVLTTAPEPNIPISAPVPALQH